MKIQSNNLAFESKIKFVDYKTFNDKVKNLNPKKHEVGRPWTADTMKKGKKLYTTDIMDCIAIGIVDKGQAVLAHIGIYKHGQAKAKHQKGFNIERLKRRFLEKIDLKNKDLHAIILGGFQLKPDDKYNVNSLNKIKHFFDENKIPCTVFGARKDVHYFGRYSLHYANKEDTWYISNNLAGARALNGKGSEIDVKKDSIVYNSYQKVTDKRGLISYDCTRKETGTEEFLKSQFRQVSVSKFDEIV